MIKLLKFNQKGLAVIFVPIVIAVAGLVGTGWAVNHEHIQELSRNRDEQRQLDILFIQDKLDKFYAEQQAYPVQKKQTSAGWQVLETELDNLPHEPLSNNGWSYYYWSDGYNYRLSYFLESDQQEQVIFSSK